MQIYRKLLHILFSFFLVLYLLLFLTENIFPGFVSSIFSLNYLLYPVLLFGIGSSLYPLTEQEQKTMNKDSDKFKKSDVYMTIILAILGTILIYYKIELEYPLRYIISGLAGLLILLTSLMVVIPEDYEWKLVMPKQPKIRYIYIWIPMLIAVVYLLINPNLYMKQANMVIKRLAPSSYKIVIVNQSGVDSYSDSYRKLLNNNGYKNIEVAASDSYPTTPKTTVMFDAEDSVAASEITEIIEQSYGVVQTAPATNSDKHTITIVLSKVSTE